MSASSRPTLTATGPHDAATDPAVSPDGMDLRALACEGVRALRALGALAGQAVAQAPAPAPAPATAPAVQMKSLVLLIALVSSPIACGAALVTWGAHENLGAADEAKADQQRVAEAEAERQRETDRAAAEEKRDAEQDAKIERLDREIMRLGWIMEQVALKVGAKVAAKVAAKEEHNDG
jgi:hypothetical protein